MRTIQAILATLAIIGLAACSSALEHSYLRSDTSETRLLTSTQRQEPESYTAALRTWRSADDINHWIGARFRYDSSRAMLLSETHRERNERLSILAPDAFYASPRGVCVDLARFAVETLRVVDPLAKPMYLMIEFGPQIIDGNVLRRHWVVSFERDGQHYFFADSKRPGYVAGPYRSTDEFLSEYAQYRGRRIVSYRLLDSYERKARALAIRSNRT
jgi:hypothetical protein